MWARVWPWFFGSTATQPSPLISATPASCAGVERTAFQREDTVCASGLISTGFPPPQDVNAKPSRVRPTRWRLFIGTSGGGGERRLALMRNVYVRRRAPSPGRAQQVPARQRNSPP